MDVILPAVRLIYRMMLVIGLKYDLDFPNFVDIWPFLDLLLRHPSAWCDIFLHERPDNSLLVYEVAEFQPQPTNV